MFERILVAVDDPESAKQAVKVATELAGRNVEAQVAMLHVIEPPVIFEACPIVPVDDIQEQMRARFEQSLHTLSGDFPKTTRISYFVLEGRPSEQIIGAAIQWNADLIVLADHNRPMISRVLLGSVADAVARRAPCTVLVARKPRVTAKEHAEMKQHLAQVSI